jgi:hypothetical protein
MLQLQIANFLELLRLKFKTSTARNVIKTQEYIVKIYNDPDESAYEYCVLSNISLFNPITFRAPKVFKFFKTQSHNALFVEYITGHRLDNYILDFLPRDNSDTVKFCYRLGKAVRELHNMDLDGLHSSPLPLSCSELKDEIVDLSKKFVSWRIIDHKLLNTILNSIL